MRDYNIYRQRAKFVNIHLGYLWWKWLPFEYICTVTGTKELNALFHNPNFCKRWGIAFHDSFTYDEKPFKQGKSWDFWDISASNPTERFLIVDDKGNPRNYYQLTDKYKKRYYHICWRRPYQHHCFHNVSEQRKSITPDEVQEIKDKYGINILPIKPKRNRNPWDNERCHAFSRGWKAQTKRRKQYKPKEMI